MLTMQEPHASLVAAVLRQRLAMDGQALICCAVRDQASSSSILFLIFIPLAQQSFLLAFGQRVTVTKSFQVMAESRDNCVVGQIQSVCSGNGDNAYEGQNSICAAKS